MLQASVSVQVLIFCGIVTCLCLITVAVYACRLLNSAKNLTDNANIIATNVQQEIEPTLKELKEAAKSINSIANSADIKFKDSKTNLATLIGAGSLLTGKLKNFTTGILKGIKFGLQVFKK